MAKDYTMDEYKAWCAERIATMGLPAWKGVRPKSASEDYLLNMHCVYYNGGDPNTIYVRDGFQKEWEWLIQNSRIGTRGVMMVPRDLPRMFEQDSQDLWWKLNARLYVKYLGPDGIIYYAPDEKRNRDVDEIIYRYEDLLDRELESLGFIYDECGNYGKEPGKIDPNLCYVNANGERRRLADAPSYGC